MHPTGGRRENNLNLVLDVDSSTSRLRFLPAFSPNTVKMGKKIQPPNIKGSEREEEGKEDTPKGMLEK